MLRKLSHTHTYTRTCTRVHTHTYTHTRTHTHTSTYSAARDARFVLFKSSQKSLICVLVYSARRVKWRYGVATISRLLKNISFFCKRALLKRGYSAKETYNFKKEPTNRSHPIAHGQDSTWCVGAVGKHTLQHAAARCNILQHAVTHR